MRRSAPVFLAIAYLGFISLGLPDAVIGVAWPFVRETFARPLSGLGVVLVATGAGYFCSSFLSGRLLHALGVGALLALSSLFVTLGLFGYAATPGWVLFVGCAFLIGLGSGAIDAGLNTYAARHFSTRQMNWLHACYGVGAMLGPLVLTAFLVRGAGWRPGYLTLAAVVLLMTVLFTITRRGWKPVTDDPAEGAAPAVGLVQTLRHPLVPLQIGVFFLYTGLEASVGQWSFSLLTGARGIDVGEAGVWVGGYWGSIAVGRVLFGVVVDRIGTDRLVRLCLATALVGALLFAVPDPAWVGFAGLVLVGLALAPIFPCLMARTPDRLGAAYAAHAIGFQVSAAMLGAAALPALAGLWAAGGLERIGLFAIGLAVLINLLHEALLRLSGPNPVSASRT